MKKFWKKIFEERVLPFSSGISLLILCKGERFNREKEA
jgi:hypothetical protein